MGLFSFFKSATSGDHDFSSIAHAYEVYNAYKANQANASAEEQKMAEEALSFLHENGERP